MTKKKQGNVANCNVLQYNKVHIKYKAGQVHNFAFQTIVKGDEMHSKMQLQSHNQK